MITKTQVLSSLDNLPEDLTVDQVIDRLIYLEINQKGLDDSKNGRINSKEEVRQKLSRWIN